MKTYRIISLGEVLWDLFPDRECFGGAPANFACHAAILGGDVAMVSAVGSSNAFWPTHRSWFREGLRSR